MSNQIASNNSSLWSLLNLLHRKNIHERIPNMRFKHITWLRLSLDEAETEKTPGADSDHHKQTHFCTDNANVWTQTIGVDLCEWFWNF